jgi:Ca2+-binding RTX toxin-like protein
MATAIASYSMDMSFQSAWFMELPANSITATRISMAFGFKEAAFIGTNFAFSANGSALSGTVTGMSYSGLDTTGTALVTHGSVTGVSASFVSFINALHPPGAAATQTSYMNAMGVLFAGADVFTGSALDDLVFGFGGNDSISGGAGSDYAEGGAGNDVLNGGVGFDTAGYSTATVAVTVSLGVTVIQNTIGAGSDTLVSVEGLVGSNFNDKLTGNAAANKLLGGNGIDTIKGLGGNDIIDGGAGNDLITGGTGRDGMIGGLGADTFIYTVLADSATYAGRDVIRDFTIGTVAGVGDKLDLRLIDAKSTVAGDQAFAFIGVANSFTGVGQLRMVNEVLYGNTDANLTTSELVIDLNLGNPASLVAGNFLL